MVTQKLKYMYNFIKMKNLEMKLSDVYYTDFNKTKRAVLWYMASSKYDALDYAMFKVYHLFGADSLTKHERSHFSILF